MEGEEWKSLCELEENISQIFSNFLARFAELEELVALGSRLLVGFRQGLEFLLRPPIDKTSELVENIIKMNDTKRVKSYVQAGCINTSDGVQNISKSKCILDGLNCLIEDATAAMQTANEDSPRFHNKEIGIELDQLAASHDNMESISSSHVEKPQVTDYAVMMGVIYCMLKQDYMMQEKIVSSLNLK